jgi:hypothetical protein
MPGLTMYSLGVVFYEMVTGTTPYKGLAGQTIVGKLAYDPAEIEWVFPDGVPSSLQFLIRSMTRKNPDDRFTDSGIISETLSSHMDQFSSSGVSTASTSSEDCTILLNPSSEDPNSLKLQADGVQKPEKAVALPTEKKSVPPGPATVDQKSEAVSPEVDGSNGDPTPSVSRNRIATGMMAVVTALIVVGGVLWLLQQWPVVDEWKEPQNSHPPPEIPSQDPPLSSSPLELSIRQLLGQMGELEDRWKVMLDDQKAAVQPLQKEVESLKGVVAEMARKDIQQVNRQTVKKIRKQVADVDKKFQQNHSRFQGIVADLQSASKNVLAKVSATLQEPIGEQGNQSLSQASRSLESYESQTLSYQNEMKKNWNKEVATLGRSLDELNKQLGALPTGHPDQPKPPPPTKDNDVDTLVDKMAELGKQWEVLLMDYKAKVKENDAVLASVKRDAEQLGRSENQLVNLEAVERVGDQLKKVHRGIQQEHTRYQKEASNLEASTKKIWTEINELKGNALDGREEARIDLASKQLQDREKQAVAYQQAASRESAVAQIAQMVEEMKRRIVKEVEGRSLQQRVDSLMARITRIREKVKMLEKTQAATIQLLHDQLQGLKNHIENLSPPDQPQLDGLSQRLNALDVKFKQNQDNSVGEMTKSKQELQSIMEDLKELKIAGLDDLQLKKVENPAQSLEESYGKLENRNREFNEVWKQEIAKNLERLREHNQALVKVQSLESIVAALGQWFQNRDLSALESATDLSDKQAKVLQALFANWKSFSVKTHYSIEKDSAKVIIQLQEMVDKRGRRAKPQQEEIIGRQVVYIPDQGGEWGKPHW